jgi:hypothetical protein
MRDTSIGALLSVEHVDNTWRLFSQHVAVDRRDLDAIRSQGSDHGIGASPTRKRSPVMGGLAAGSRLEVDCGCDSQRSDWSELHAAYD